MFLFCALRAVLVCSCLMIQSVQLFFIELFMLLSLIQICWILHSKPFYNPVINLNKLEAFNFGISLFLSYFVLSSSRNRNEENIRVHDNIMIFGLCLLNLEHLAIILYFLIKDLQVFINLKVKATDTFKRVFGINS